MSAFPVFSFLRNVGTLKRCVGALRNSAQLCLAALDLRHGKQCKELNIFFREISQCAQLLTALQDV